MSSKQFDGQGSLGNGGAMRIAPMALFCQSRNYSGKKLVALVEEATRITHTNILGIQGAVLQCAAVHLALQSDSTVADFNPVSFVDKLLAFMKEHVGEEFERSPYAAKLNQIKVYLTASEPVQKSEVVQNLGNNITALGSVPSALYSFLRSTLPVHDDEIPSKYNGFEKTIVYAISLGGDTDTMATMAGAIAGAHYGVGAISDGWKLACEGVEHAEDQAKKLFNLRFINPFRRF